MFYTGAPLYPFGHGLSYTQFELGPAGSGLAQFGDVAVICADISQLRAPPSTPKITPPSAQPLRIIHFGVAAV